MSTAERSALMTEVLKLSNWFRTNASIKHGHPERETMTQLEKETAQAATKQEQVPSPLGQPQAAPAESLLNRLLKAGALVALMGGGGGGLLAGAGYALNAWNGDGQVQTETAPPIEQAPIVEQAPSSILPYLEEGGFHLPPEGTQ